MYGLHTMANSWTPYYGAQLDSILWRIAGAGNLSKISVSSEMCTTKETYSLLNQLKILICGEQNYPHLLVVLVIIILDDDDDGDDWSGNVFVEISSKCFPLKEGAGAYLGYIRTNNKWSSSELQPNTKARKMQNFETNFPLHSCDTHFQAACFYPLDLCALLLFSPLTDIQFTHPWFRPQTLSHQIYQQT